MESDGLLFFACRQKADLLGHELWVGQRVDGRWQVWIEGKRPLLRETMGVVFNDPDEANSMAHMAAHRHFEGNLGPRNSYGGAEWDSDVSS